MSDTERSPDKSGSRLEPYLPPELEYTIFTSAFDALDHKTNLAMLLVAKRVHEWVIPLIYRTVDQVGEYPIPNFSKPGCPTIEQIGGFVHHLIMGQIHETDEDAHRLLVHCPNLKSLACWYSLSVKNWLQSLANTTSLRMISGKIQEITEDDLRNPIFLNLTHVELVSTTEETLSLLPAYIQHSRVTHLRFYDLQVWNMDKIQMILDVGSNLEALILCEPYDASDPESEALRICPPILRTMHQKDQRLVIIESNLCNADDWIKGARGFYDSWIYADQIITARKKKYFKKGEFQNNPFISGFNWLEHLIDEGKEWYSKEWAAGRHF
ncbi:hypothetical protein BJ165DRAFT_1500456 [Panaeolus papilionaceus]|nr:hypothetical protein BJ165DRAFT_1500456 [Panaeolus papilionaceus]